MKKFFRSIICVFISLSFLFMSGITDVFADSYPTTVRIGLNYGSDSVTSVSMSAKKGITVGSYSNGNYINILDENSSNPIIARKDGYFVRTNDGRLMEYSPAEGVPYAGETMGPYHIKIGGTSPDYQTALSLVNNILKSDIEAYAVYENGWQVWTGFYPDANTANAQIGNVSSKLGTGDLTVIPPTSSRIIVYSSSYKILMLFGGIDGYLQIRPKQENSPYIMSVNGKNYRGYVEIRRYSDSDLTVINILDIEQYLYGVVPYEIEADAPLEALKAQAVAARTFSYRSIGANGKWGFDMVDTEYSQVYNGYDGERSSSNQAIDETKGKKILYKGSLAQVFYFSSSGGMTADNRYVWGTEIPYIRSVEDPYESQTSYKYFWQVSLSPEQIKKTLFIDGVDIGNIISVSVEEYSPSGRAAKLVITGTGGENGKSKTYERENTRWIFNLYSQKYKIIAASNVVIRSIEGVLSTVALNGKGVVTASGQLVISSASDNMVLLGAENTQRTISLSSNNYVFDGKGWGHGLGMSQEGAKGFARNGYTYDQILKHYYTGVTVE